LPGFCDFAELLLNWRDIAWKAIFEWRNEHSSRPLLLETYLATSLLDAPAPAEAFEKAQTNSAVRTLAEKAQLKMYGKDSQDEVDEFFNGDRLLAIGSLLRTLTVGDFQAMPLPKSLWRIYYLTRPFRVASKVPMLKNLPTSIGTS